LGKEWLTLYDAASVTIMPLPRFHHQIDDFPPPMPKNNALATIEKFLVSRDAKASVPARCTFSPVSLSLRDTAAEYGSRKGCAELESDASGLLARASRSHYPLIGIAGMLNSGKSVDRVPVPKRCRTAPGAVGRARAKERNDLVFWLPEQLPP